MVTSSASFLSIWLAKLVQSALALRHPSPLFLTLGVSFGVFVFHLYDNRHVVRAKVVKGGP